MPVLIAASDQHAHDRFDGLGVWGTRFIYSGAGVGGTSSPALNKDLIIGNTMDTYVKYNVAIDNGITAYPNQQMTFEPSFVSEYGAQDGYLVNDTKCNGVPTTCQLSI